MRRIFRGWIVLFAIIISLSACQDASTWALNPPWKPDEVRFIDPIDAPLPEHELVALYTRDLFVYRQVRLDFLDLAEMAGFDLHLFLDHLPAGEPEPTAQFSGHGGWDTIVRIRATGDITTEQYDNVHQEWIEYQGLSIQVLRNPVLDTLEISLAGDRLGDFSPKTRLMAVLTEPGGSQILDEIEPVRWDGASAQRLPILMAFSNTFPAFTPAQGLRRWDGAHTGPRGGRHGLSNLLRISRNHQVHILLLDLLSRHSLSAINYHQGLADVKVNYQAQLLSLANPLPFPSGDMPGWMAEYFIASSQAMALEARLPQNTITYEPAGVDTGENLPEMTLPEFHSWDEPVSIAESMIRMNTNGMNIRLPAFQVDGEPDQATPDGLSLPWKEFLARAAWQINHPDQPVSSSSLVVMGGSLPQSTWGHPASARAAFRYIQSHPWLRLASKVDLQPGIHLVQPTWSGTLPSDEAGMDSGDLQPAWLMQELQSNPDNPLGQAAWDAYHALFAPIFPLPDNLPVVRQRYLGEVSKLIAAAHWVESPVTSLTCAVDPDHDGVDECIYSTDSLFAIFELEAGFLSNLVISCDGNAHQVIASSAQLITGLSDPLDWDLSSSFQVDPLVIPGAFVGPSGQYKLRAEGDSIWLSTPDDGVRKRFRFYQGGLRIVLLMDPSLTHSGAWSIPLILDPWERFNKNGSNSYRLLQQPGAEDNVFTWGVEGGFQVAVSSPGTNGWVTFKDSRSDIVRPENPDFEYPEGHYLPYPLAIVEWFSQEEMVVELHYQCPP